MSRSIANKHSNCVECQKITLAVLTPHSLVISTGTCYDCLNYSPLYYPPYLEIRENEIVYCLVYANDRSSVIEIPINEDNLRLLCNSEKDDFAKFIEDVRQSLIDKTIKLCKYLAVFDKTTFKFGDKNVYNEIKKIILEC